MCSDSWEDLFLMQVCVYGYFSGLPELPSWETATRQRLFLFATRAATVRIPENVILRTPRAEPLE